MVDSIPTCSTSRRFDGCKHIPAFKDLHLSDPGYSPGSQLDMLLGISHCNVCSLPNVIVSADKTFRAEETIFGWAVGGSSPVATGGASSTCLKMITYHDDISEQLQRFWSLEEVPGEPTLYTDEEKAAVTHFQDTHKRSPNGRYIVGVRTPTVLHNNVSKCFNDLNTHAHYLSCLKSAFIGDRRCLSLFDSIYV